MTQVYHRSLFLPGPAGRLEAQLWTRPASDNPPLAAVVCHPHPLYGGTLHNKVVFQTAKTLHRIGLPVLRFNFRGAGRSGGVHDGGRGELDDVRATIGFLSEQFPGLPILLAGFSFGAWVGLRVGCDNGRVAELIGLGLPVDGSDFSSLQACTKPKLFLQGDKDRFGSPEKVKALVASIPEPKRLVIIEDADHFFAGKLQQVDAVLRSWMRERHPELEG